MSGAARGGADGSAGPAPAEEPAAEAPRAAPTAPILRLLLEYDGTGFEGWQAQPSGHRTVQGVLEEALARLAGQRVAVVGAGRTDAGVHAEGQVASLVWPGRLPPEVLVRALGAHLPRDLSVRCAAPAPPGFHARRDATAKLYRYAIWNGPQRSPLRDRRFLFESRPLDVAAMRAAARALVGRHDFRSFQAAGSSVGSSVRTLRRLEVAGRAGHEVVLHAEGDGFLRHMVRILAGTLLRVGKGRIHPCAVPAILAARRREAAGPTAPARGLTLVRVEYRKRPERRVFRLPGG